MKAMHIAETGQYNVPLRNLKLMLASLLVCIVVFTGGTSIALNTVFIAASLVLSIMDYKSFGYVFYAGGLVYFGYSYIELNNYLSASLGSVGYLYFLSLAIIIGRSFRSKRRNKVLAMCPKVGICFFLFILWYSFNRLSVSMITAVGSLFQLLVVGFLLIDFQEESQASKIFVQSLVFFLFSTYVYVLLWRNLLSADLRSGFCGARDGNNFSYLCNLCIVLLYYSKLRNKKILTLFLAISTILTISISGVATLIMIFVVLKALDSRRQRAIRWGILLSTVLVFVGLFGSMFLSSLALSDSTIGRLAQRIMKIFAALEEGNYESATTSRTMLWGYYWARYSSFTFAQKLFGSYAELYKLQSTYYASHNVFLDLLMGSGFLGLAFFVMLYLKSARQKLRRGEIQRVLISLIFLTNLFFRTFSGFSMLFPILF